MGQRLWTDERYEGNCAFLANPENLTKYTEEAKASLPLWLYFGREQLQEPLMSRAELESYSLAIRFASELHAE